MTAGIPSPEVASEELVRIVDAATSYLRKLPARNVEHGTTGWSGRQTLGHLIDSAANNHARFVRGQIEEDLVFPGYSQDEWVELQAYEDQPWDELVELWRLYNRHIARVIARIDPQEWSRPRARHNFDRIGFASVEASRLGSLGWLVVDYIAHMKHHLEKINALSQ